MRSSNTGSPSADAPDPSRPASPEDELAALRGLGEVLAALRRQYPRADDGDLVAMLRGSVATLDALGGLWPDRDDAGLAAAARELAASPLAADLLHRVLDGEGDGVDAGPPSPDGDGSDAGGPPSMPFAARDRRARR